MTAFSTNPKKSSSQCKTVVHLILQRNYNIYHSWKYAVHNENRIAVVWPGCSRREVRQLGCYEASWTSRVLTLLALCWHACLFFFFFFPSPEEWKTSYLHRVMAVLLCWNLHPPPHERFVLLFKVRSGGRSYLKLHGYLGGLTFLYRCYYLLGKNLELGVIGFHPCQF